VAIQVGYIIYSLHRKCIVLIHSAYRLNKKWRKARDLEGNRDEQEYNVLMQDSSLVCPWLLRRMLLTCIRSAYRLNKRWRKARDLEGNRDEQEYNMLMQDSSLVSLPVTWQYVAHLTGGELVLV